MKTMNRNKDRTRNSELPDREPLRYRMRAKLLYQGRAIPRTVRAYLREQFPRMCRRPVHVTAGDA